VERRYFVFSLATAMVARGTDLDQLTSRSTLSRAAGILDRLLWAPYNRVGRKLQADPAQMHIAAPAACSKHLGMGAFVAAAWAVVRRHQTTVHGVRFRLQAEASPVGSWDGEASRRVIENLCVNAIRYGRPGGPATLTLREASHEAVIEVLNEGSPIPPKDLSAIFTTRFRREERLRGAGKGWALGLTVVKGPVGAHGGRVELHSAQCEGTTFRVLLPLDTSPVHRYG